MACQERDAGDWRDGHPAEFLNEAAAEPPVEDAYYFIGGNGDVVSARRYLNVRKAGLQELSFQSGRGEPPKVYWDVMVPGLKWHGKQEGSAGFQDAETFAEEAIGIVNVLKHLGMKYVVEHGIRKRKDFAVVVGGIFIFIGEVRFASSPFQPFVEAGFGYEMAVGLIAASDFKDGTGQGGEPWL